MRSTSELTFVQSNRKRIKIGKQVSRLGVSTGGYRLRRYTWSGISEALEGEKGGKRGRQGGELSTLEEKEKYNVDLRKVTPALIK